jgi:BON domain
MADEEQSHRVWTRALGSAALGAMAMYVLDQDRGRRRRAIATDRARRLALDSRDAMRAAARDVSNRLRAVRARAGHLFRQEGVPDDLQLIERVRAKIGRLVAHPHAIQVGANQGRVTLSGPVLAREVDRLLHAVRGVHGVSDIEDQLLAYERSASIPSLQGGGMQASTRGDLVQWTPALRAGAMVGGGLVALYGLRQRNVSGIALLMLGLGLALSGASAVPAERLVRYARNRRRR